MSRTDAPIASGPLYPIVSVGGVQPAQLADFAGADVRFVIAVPGSEVTVVGAGAQQDNSVVRFHEKDPDSGKDVRVWCIEQSETGFTAEALSAEAPLG